MSATRMESCGAKAETQASAQASTTGTTAAIHTGRRVQPVLAERTAKASENGGAR